MKELACQLSAPGPGTLFYEALRIVCKDIIEPLRAGMGIGYRPAAPAVSPSGTLTTSSFVRASVAKAIQHAGCGPDLA